MKKFSLVALLVALVSISLVSCSTDDDNITQYGSVQLNFSHVFEGSDIVMNTQKYITSGTDSLEISKLKYFVSNVKFYDTEGNIAYTAPDSYHLVTYASDAEDYAINFSNVPVGTYSKIEYAIGVDSVMNHQIDNTGDLDPNSDMVWTWNTGYKFFVLEGSTYTSTETGGVLVFHIGMDSNYKEVELDLASQSVNNISVEENVTSHVAIDADIKKVFTHSTTISLDNTSHVTMGPESMSIANNYVNMFTVTSVN